MAHNEYASNLNLTRRPMRVQLWEPFEAADGWPKAPPKPSLPVEYLTLGKRQGNVEPSTQEEIESGKEAERAARRWFKNQKLLQDFIKEES